MPGGRVWYRQSGDGQGTPLLCLHGGPGARSNYLQGLEALGPERPVIRYDQLGSGRSEYTPSDDLWRTERFVAELAAVRAALSLDRVHLYGHSWGTMLAVAYLLRGAPGVASLTLVSPWLSVARYLEDIDVLVARLPAETRATITLIARDEEVAPEAAEAAIRSFYAEYFCRDAVALGELFQGGPPGPAYEAMWGPNEFTCSSPILAGVDLTPRLGELDLPVLLLCGEYDSCTPETTLAFQSLIPGSEAVVLPGCSHMNLLEDPAAHLAAVSSFLTRVDP